MAALAKELADTADAKAYRSKQLPFISGQQQQHIPPRHADVVIVGAGFAGMSLATAFVTDGVTDVAILQKSTAVGGVWSERGRPVSAQRYQEEAAKAAQRLGSEKTAHQAGEAELKRQQQHSRRRKRQPHLPDTSGRRSHTLVCAGC